MNFVEELKWRGMLHDIMPETEKLLNTEVVKGYIGFDPRSDSLGIGNMVQANSISTLVQEAFQIPMWITGLLLTVLTAVVIIGGIKSIANVCELLVPFMAITYVLGCLIILGMNIS